MSGKCKEWETEDNNKEHSEVEMEPGEWISSEDGVTALSRLLSGDETDSLSLGLSV